MLPKKSVTSVVFSDPSISAVIKCVNLVIQHNFLVNIIDHLAPIIRQEFSESKSARKFTCGKKKSIQIIKFSSARVKNLGFTWVKFWNVDFNIEMWI